MSSIGKKFVLFLSLLGWIIIIIPNVFRGAPVVFPLNILIAPVIYFTLFYHYIGVVVSVVLMAAMGYYYHKKKISFSFFLCIILVNLLYIIVGHSMLNELFDMYMSV